jgi:hypothetical protein
VAFASYYYTYISIVEYKWGFNHTNSSEASVARREKFEFLNLYFVKDCGYKFNDKRARAYIYIFCKRTRENDKRPVTLLDAGHVTFLHLVE